MPKNEHKLTITLDPETLTRLRRAYDQAVSANQSQFVFDGNEFDTRYAGYLLQYVTQIPQIKRRGE